MGEKPRPDRYRVAMVLANSFAVRNTLQTPVLNELAARPDLEVVFLTPSPQDQERIHQAGADNLSWRLLHRPVEGVGLGYGGIRALAWRLCQRLVMRAARPWASFGNLVYRFNEIQGFVGHRQKKSLSEVQRAREAKAGNYVDPWLGCPWPRSRLVLRLLHWFYYATWYSEPAVEAFLDAFRPHLLVLHHIQFESIRPYSTAARRRRLSTLGVVASWDQPTTKGPLCPGMARYVVQSLQMRGELQRWHGVDPGRVEVVGWPQMDYYRRPNLLRPRQEFLAELGLEPHRRLVLLGANSARLGAHEPGIAAHLARSLDRLAPAGDATLIVRPHPNDGQWPERFGYLHDPPRVVVLPAEWGRLDFLANLLHHAAVLLATGGTIHLDAVALDTCAVAIGFADGQGGERDGQVRRWYEMDHYQPVVKSGGVRLVTSFEELDQAVKTYLDDPTTDAEGRQRCRQEQLEPLDGQSSARLVNLIATEAQRAAGGRQHA